MLLGPLLPILAERSLLSDSLAGYLVTSQFLGSLIGTVSSGFVVARRGLKGTLIVGLGLMACGAAMLRSGSYIWVALAALIYGVGIGATVPTANLLVAQCSESDRPASLNLLNFFWSAGAVACPFLLALFGHYGRTGVFLILLAGWLVLMMLVVAVTPLPKVDAKAATEYSLTRSTSGVQTPTIFVLCGLFFLYVGTETAFGAWLASYTKRTIVGADGAWMTVSAYFYAAILAGRLAAAANFFRVPESARARAGSALAAFSVIALFYARTLTSLVLAILLIGVGMSTLYPTAISIASTRLGGSASRVMGYLFALSTIGGAIVPWLVGYVSTRFGGLHVALLVPFIGSCVVAVLFWIIPSRNTQIES